MKKYTESYILNHIQELNAKLGEVDNNLKYIKVLKALKLWLERFSELFTTPEESARSYEYQAYFYGCGISFYDRVCNSILDYEYGNKPF